MYADKRDKVGMDGVPKAMEEMFKTQMKILQFCELCKIWSKSDKQVFNDDQKACNNYCDACYVNDTVGDICSSISYTSVHPQLRQCTTCCDETLKCVMRAIIVLTIDCEDASMLSGTIETNFALTTVIPNPPHVGKSMTASFSNWFLKLRNEPGNLSILNK